MFRRNKYQIWKLQRPVVANGFPGVNTIMGYTEDQQRIVMIPATTADMDALFKSELKVYVVARMRHNQLEIKEYAHPQDW